jgi:4-hydroxy-4-methyl-2-oxoglutarate aldolase
LLEDGIYRKGQGLTEEGRGLAYGHEPRVAPCLGSRGPQLPAAWDKVAGHLRLADVVDQVGPLYTMDTGIRPLWPYPGQLVGRALTVKAWPGDNLAIHGSLALAEPGDVLVVDWRGCVTACGAGGHITAAAQAQGLRGVVIDGAWRDIDEIAELGFPVFGRGECSFSPLKNRAGEIGVPVSCGGVVVAPGDVIFADKAGVAVVPAAFAEEIAADLLAATQAPPALSSPGRRLTVYLSAFERSGGRSAGNPDDWQRAP